MKYFLITFITATLYGQVAGLPTNLDLHGDHPMPMPSNVHVNTGVPNDLIEGRVVEGVEAPFVPVLTRSYDATRSGANTHETILKPTNVGGLTKLYTHILPGDARGIEAQPLIVPSVSVNDEGTMDLAIYATMGNMVYAFDANSDKLVWARSLGRPIVGNRNIDGWQINSNWGVLSTPVIDPRTNLMYVVSWSDPNGKWQTATHSLHVINITDGHEVSHTSFEGVTYDPGYGLPVQVFKSSERKQRASLAIADIEGVPTVFIQFGTIFESSEGNRGWVIAYNTKTAKFVASWTSTSRFSGGGIWGAGAAPALVSFDYGHAVNLLFLTGNGSFDGVTDFGESFMSLTYTAELGFVPQSWFTPFTDAGRVGDDPTSSHITKVNNCCGYDDMDLGSGGLTYIQPYGIVLGAGKDGIAYTLNAFDFGRTQLSYFAYMKDIYAAAKWIGFFTFPSALDLAQYGSPGSPTPDNVMDLNKSDNYANRTHHVHGSPVWFQDGQSIKVFIWGENGNGRCFRVNLDGSLTFLANTAETASPESPVPSGGMPGGMLSLSSNGTADGLLWATVPLGDANKQVTQGNLYVYDASNYGKYSDGSGELRLLWKSPTYTYNKFDPPVISGGRVFVPTYAGSVDVYGLPQFGSTQQIFNTITPLVGEHSAPK